jgi:hypothetical protein
VLDLHPSSSTFSTNATASFLVIASGPPTVIRLGGSGSTATDATSPAISPVLTQRRLVSPGVPGVAWTDDRDLSCARMIREAVIR